MKYTYIKLVKSKRLPFIDSDIFETNITEKVIIVSGINGAGKSSLISEFSPLPADKTLFYKGGYKEVHIEKDNSIYKLVSDFTQNSPVFRFILNDEELNNSNNVTTQRELAYRHFGINQAIEELMNSRESFTEMGSISRKKLFNSLSKLNIDSVLEQYERIKEELKTQEALLKSQLSIYQTEQDKQLNENRALDLESTINLNRQRAELLLDIRANLHRYKSTQRNTDCYTTYKEKLSLLKSTISKHANMFVAYPAGDLSRIESWLTSQLAIESMELDTLYTRLNKAQDLLISLRENEKSNISSLKETKSNLETSLTANLGTLKYIKETPDDVIKSDIYRLESVLPECLYAIETNEDRRYSTVKYAELKAYRTSLLDIVSSCGADIAAIDKEIAHLLEHNDTVNCPKCDHSWSPSDSKTRLSNHKLSKELLVAKKAQAQESILKTDKTIEKFDEYFFNYRTYSSVRKATQYSLSSFWSEVDSQELIFKNPKNIIARVSALSLDVASHGEIERLKKEIAKVESSIESVISTGDCSASDTAIEISDLTAEITELQLLKRETKASLDRAQLAKRVYSVIDTVSMELEALRNDIHTEHISEVTSSLINTIDDDLRTTKITLIELEAELSNHASIKTILAKYEVNIQETKTNIKVLEAIADELSPKNGLIAKTVSSLLNVVINSVNKTLQSLWNYKMVLKLIDVETETLNYKFKLEVDDRLEIEDVSKASAGMRKVINFAFVSVLYDLLGLKQYPLYLDEFSVNLDSNHVQKFTHIVNQIAMSDKYSQLFVISHLNNDSCFTEQSIQHIDLS